MISVILPIYNVEPYLEKCLNSILMNTYRDLEVICVNDGSTDGCSYILSKWQAIDSRIIVINQDNKGLAVARNTGLDAATGDFIAFVDSDDWIHPKYFQSMINCMNQNNADMVVCRSLKFNIGDEIEIDYSLEPHFHRLSAIQFYRGGYTRYQIWGKLLRRRDVEGVHFAPEVHCMNDTLYNLRIITSLNNPKVYETDSIMYYYLQRPGSLVRSHPYEEQIHIAEWYVKNRNHINVNKVNSWGWQLLEQSITMTLLCRYQATSRNNRILVERTNQLLGIMISDLKKNKDIGFCIKAVLLAFNRFPAFFRLYLMIVDPELIKIERNVAAKKDCGM